MTTVGIATAGQSKMTEVRVLPCQLSIVRTQLRGRGPFTTLLSRLSFSENYAAQLGSDYPYLKRLSIYLWAIGLQVLMQCDGFSVENLGHWGLRGTV